MTTKYGEKTPDKAPSNSKPASKSGFFATHSGDQVREEFIEEGAKAAPKAIPAGTWPSPIDGFRAAVHAFPLVGLIAVGDEKTPYPTGTPLGAGKHFWLQNGYYKSATPTVE